MTPSLRSRPHRVRGFTLIEALVALLVLSIGLLGIAALQLSSLRSNYSASLRSQATLLAYDIVDRMRANQIAAANGAYIIGLTTTPTGGSGIVAQDDLARWKQNLTDTLGPTAQGSIASAGVGSAATYTITIQWDDSRGADPTPLSFVMVTQI